MTAIREPWGLSVLGAGSVTAEPRFAEIDLAVDVVAPTPKESYTEAGTVVAGLRAVLREHDIPDADVSGSRLRLTSEYAGYGAERTFKGYGCEAKYTVRTQALDRLEVLIDDLVTAGVNRVDDVRFEVEDKPAMRDEARRRAVAAARRKAGVYAEACGVRLGAVIHIQDVDPESTGMRSHGRRTGGDPEHDGALAPGSVQVEAAVLLGFALLP
ncbi:SIMPL domain-containing protein [Streptomyces sp. NBC_00597]|uniref:SIMPL domain-containing protein n=1 Tax=unclassified Streptomyces TaxID=2593676 RepID=UPI002E0EC3E7|nr:MULTISPECIES: SIMPL domain-containing protein [unclassified Streptomyces]WSR25507.1 SIMPL domain-containing protein [Streptomyces sp. NBC_01205]